MDITGEVKNFVSDACAREGTVALFIRHTSASLTRFRRTPIRRFWRI